MNRLITALVATGGLVASASAVHANVEIGGTAGVHTFSTTNELGVDDSPTADSERNSALFGLRLGIMFNDMVGIEGEFGVIPSESRNLVFDVWNITYRGHVIVQFRAKDPANKLVPFVLGGGGAMQVVSTGNQDLIAKDTDAELYFGAGIKYRVDNGFGLRVDGRMLFPPSSASKGVTEDFELLLSIYKEFGRKAPVKELPPPPKDTDGDGITDDKDKCPTEPEDKDGFQDADGCPDPDNDNDGIPDTADKCPNEAGPKENDGCPDKDTDGDGIVDRLDKCPTEAGIPENQGCPDKDTDGDGIVDRLDKCPTEPETKNGYQDADGCPDEIPQKMKQFTGAVQGINFKTGDSAILPASFKVLDKAIEVLKEFGDLRMEIQGHTDDVALVKRKGGKFDDNTALSQARAESVMAYMVGKGIDAGRLSAKGYGETVPLEDYHGLKGAKLNAARTKNRRVEFKLISK